VEEKQKENDEVESEDGEEEVVDDADEGEC